MCFAPRARAQTSDVDADEPSGADYPAAIEEPAAEEEDLPEATDSADAELEVHVGGALRFSYTVKSWDEAAREQGGALILDTFRVNVDATYGPLSTSAEYRFYRGYQMLHHGYIGYTFAPWLELQAGVSRVPFGILPYASHSWFFDLPYYLGLEDDYDLGLKALMPLGSLDLQLAFYKQDEGSYIGSSIASARYSYDVVPTDDTELGYAGLAYEQANRESNQGNVRLAYRLNHDGSSYTELGLSGQLGQLYNALTDSNGHHWAAAAHLDGHWGRFNLQLQGSHYDYRPENPAGQSDNFVTLGAYDFPYKVASRAWLIAANLSYFLPVARWPLDSLTFYNDFSAVLKTVEGYADSYQNVTGFLVAVGPLYTYVDVAAGKNHPWIGTDYGAALAEGDEDADWEIRFNVNLGIYY